MKIPVSILCWRNINILALMSIFKNYYDIRESSGFKNVSLAVSIIARVDVSYLSFS